MIGFDVSALVVDDASEGAAVGLYALMAGISEEFWCAGWMHGLEYALWDALTNDGRRSYGRGYISERQRDLLRMLADECCGWWMWDTDLGRIGFVRLPDWRQIVERRSA